VKVTTKAAGSALPAASEEGRGMTGRPLASFSEAELGYLLGERRLGRLATADATGTPHVVPVGWRYNPELGTIDVSGLDLTVTKKFRNVRENPRAAFVVDDLASTVPWRPRSVMVQGSATAVEAAPDDRPAVGGAVIRIFPERIVSWGIGAPDG
jgi:pyridoxamine 5'-phosphate oxidase family protein